MVKIRLLSFATALSLLGWLPLPAQSIYGEIRGTVTDATGAVVADAGITTRNTATGAVRKSQTDNSGNYSLVNLEAGIYEVSVERPGFRKALTREVVLRAREVARVDTGLEVAPAATEVMVITARQVVTTDQATIVDSKSFDDIQNLPVNFRAGTTNSVFPSISLAPGVQADLNGASLSLSGSMPFMASASVDGITTINVRTNGLLTEMFPSADSIDELKVSSIGNNAEHAQIGDITTTSRSGSNNLHGSAYWYHQNGAFDARDFFATRPGAPFKISNDFGGSLGGPIVPNRTFFFGAYEGLRYVAQNQINIIVPPDSYRIGDLSSVAAPVRDPLATTPFPGNLIPASRIHPVSANTLELLFPRQNQPGNSIAAPNYRLQKGAGNRNDQYDLRGDHILNERQNLFARFSSKDVTRRLPLPLTTMGDDRTLEKSRSLVAAHNFVIRPTLVNEFRAGYSDSPREADFGPDGSSLDGPALVRELGITGLRPDPPDVASVPDIGILGFQLTGRRRGGTTLSRAFQFTDSLTWMRGRHTFKFGADLRRLRTTDLVSFFHGDNLGEYRFSGVISGNPTADLLLGYPQWTRVANTGPDIDGVAWHQGFFAQDDFKVNPRLTLNLGVRYEYHPPFFDSNLQITNFDRDFPGGRVVVPNEESLALTAPGFRAAIGDTPIVTAREAGIPESLRFADKNNFAPRVGFAWRPFDNRTVIRGGYGIYSVTLLGSVFYSLVGIHTSDTRTFNNTLVNGVPQLQFPSPFLSGLGSVGAAGSADFRRANQIDAPDPYVQQWNFTVERDLGWNTGVRVTYTGSHSLKLFYSPDLNQVQPNTVGYGAARANRPYPNWAIVYSRDAGASAKFNGLVTEVQKRFSNGLFFQSSWAWSKNLTNATGTDGLGFAGESGAVPTDRYNLGLDYGNLAPTRRHRWLTTFTYMLPVGRSGKVLNNAGRLADALLGGWQLSGLLLFQTGPFLTPITGGKTDPSGTNLNARANDRPDYAGSGYGNISSGRTIDAWFDPSAFTMPPSNIGRFGQAGPGSLVGPGTNNVSAKLQKRFSMGESRYLQVEGSFSNVANHPNFSLPARNVSLPSFGRITSTQGAEFGGSRTVQVGLRLAF
ncbi:MAG: TonB-dependent receptor [Bryobacteraceae bacterium]